MATEHTLRLGIDGTGARQGAGVVVRSLEDIRKKSAEAAGGLDRLEAAGKKLTSVGKSLTLFLSVPLTAAGAAFVKLASDAEETRAKFDAVFKGLSASTRAWARELGAALGRNQVELEGFLARLQDTFVPLGFSRDRAAELSKTLTVLATDLAAFDNIAESDAIDLMTSAIVGNHEAVRRFGIIISEATIKAELLRMGIAGGTRAATEQEKVQARLNIIMGSSADAQGQAAREADGAANSFKSLASAAKDASIAIGERLLPVVIPMVKNVAEMLRGVSDMNPEVIKWGIALAGVGIVVGPLATGLGALALAVKALAIAGLGVTAAWTGGLSLAVAGLGAFWLKSKIDAAEAATAVERYTKSLGEMNVTQLIVQRNALSAQRDQLAGEIERLSRNPKGNRYRISRREGALAQVDSALESVNAALMAGVTQSPVEVLITKPIRDAKEEARKAGEEFDRMWTKAAAGQSSFRQQLERRSGLLAGVAYDGGPGFDNTTGRELNPALAEGARRGMNLSYQGSDLGNANARSGPRSATIGEHASMFGSRARSFAADAPGNALKGLASGAMALLNVFNPLSIIATIFHSALESVTPALEGLQPVVEMVAKLFGGALAPLIEGMFPIFKMLAIAATYVGQIFFNVAGGIAQAVGFLLKAIGWVVDKLNIFGGDGGIGKLGRAIERMGVGFIQAASGLADARHEIEKIEFDDAAKAVRDFTDAMTDVPKVVNLALYRSRVTGTGPTGSTGSDSNPVGTNPGGGVTQPGTRDPVPASIHIDAIHVVNEAGDDEVSMARKVARGVQRAYSQGSPIHMPGLVVAK